MFHGARNRRGGCLKHSVIRQFVNKASNNHKTHCAFNEDSLLGARIYMCAILPRRSEKGIHLRSMHARNVVALALDAPAFLDSNTGRIQSCRCHDQKNRKFGEEDHPKKMKQQKRKLGGCHNEKQWRVPLQVSATPAHTHVCTHTKKNREREREREMSPFIWPSHAQVEAQWGKRTRLSREGLMHVEPSRAKNAPEILVKIASLKHKCLVSIQKANCPFFCLREVSLEKAFCAKDVLLCHSKDASPSYAAHNDDATQDDDPITKLRPTQFATKRKKIASVRGQPIPEKKAWKHQDVFILRWNIYPWCQKI